MPLPLTLPVRVMVEQVWDDVSLDVQGSTPVGDLKALALTRAGVTDDPAQYVMKYLGAELQDEDQSLADAGIVPKAGLVVLARRRRPLR